MNQQQTFHGTPEFIAFIEDLGFELTYPRNIVEHILKSKVYNTKYKTWTLQ